MRSGTTRDRLLNALERTQIIRTFTDEAHRLSAGIVTAARTNFRAVDLVLKTYTTAHILRGSATYVDASGDARPLEAGDMLQRFPGVKHSLLRTDDGEWLEFFIVLPLSVYEGLRALGILDFRRDVIRPGVDEELLERITQFLEWLRDHIDADPAVALLEAQRMVVELHHRDQGRRSDDPDAVTMRRASLALRRDLGRALSMPEVAERCGLGYEKFRKLFVQTHGVSPKQYRLRYRIDEAKRQLLEGARSIKQIAYALGYSETANFAAQFKRLTGVSPGAYRRRR